MSNEVGTPGRSKGSTRISITGRRVGYLVALSVNALVWYGLNTWPGWEVVPFLTSDTMHVLGFVNASIVASIIANLVFLAWDPPWLRALGDLVSVVVGLLALVALWQVFPFSFADAAFWPLVARTVLVVGLAGGCISVVVQLVTLARIATGSRRNTVTSREASSPRQ